MDEEPERPGWRAGVLGAVGRGSTAACLPGGPNCPGPLWVECTKSKDQNQAQEGEAGSQGSVRPEVSVLRKPRAVLRSCVDRPAEEPLCLGEPSPEPCSSESLCEFSAAKQGVKE